MTTQTHMADECKRGGAGSWVRGRLGQPGVIATAIIGAVMVAGGLLAAGSELHSHTPATLATAATTTSAAPAPAGEPLSVSTYDPITPLPVVRVEHYPRYEGETTGVESQQWRETFNVTGN